MPQFSVKKPMTVLVAVILVIMLGVVAFINMTPDLLPNIELPYVLVVTSYVGASPEEIEQSITKPVEQSMSTLDHIKTISSTSNENYSLVMMQFADEADMDAVSMNIREKLNLLSNSWNEYVGVPTILKLNPNMIPLMVSAVNLEGADATELSRFYDETLAPYLEGVEGVASVTATGRIYETVDVRLNQTRIDAVNVLIRAAIDREFADSLSQLEEKRQEVADGYAELEDGEEAIDGALYEAGAQGDLAMERLQWTENDLLQQRSSLQAKYDQLSGAVNGLRSIQSGITALDAQIAPMQAALDAYNADPANPAYAAFDANATAAAIAGLSGQRQILSGQLSAAEAAAGMTLGQLESALGQLSQALGQIDSALTQIREGRGTAREAIGAAKGQIREAEEEISAARKQLDEASEQLDDAQQQINDAQQNAADQSDLNGILTLSNVGAILSAQNFSMPAGYALGEDGTQTLIYVGDKLGSAEELSQMVLMDLGLDGLEPIRVSDVADISVTNNSAETYAKIDLSDGVLLSFNKQSGYATATVSDNIQARFEELSQKYPGLTFTSLMDQGDYIRLVISSVLENIGLGAILAVVILLLFLWDIRPTFVVACSIPVSVTFAIVLMYFSGVTLNIISMSGLAVGVGMLVDNSIVVIENIYRLRREGMEVKAACVTGAKQVAGAITASTLTTVCVFVPIVFITGITRQLFTDMALTIAYSLLASLLVALTLVPALSSGVLAKTRSKPQKLYEAMIGAYDKALGFTLRHRVACVLLATALLGASVLLCVQKGFTYMPDMDSTQISVSIALPEDAVLEDTRAVGDAAAQRILAMPEVESVGVMTSGGLGSMVGLSAGNDTVNSATMYVVLSDARDKTSLELAGEIEAACADLDGEITADGAGGMGSYTSVLGGSGITVNLYSNDLLQLAQAARDMAEVLAAVPGIAQVDDGMDASAPAVRITVDKNAAMAQGLTTAQIYQYVAQLLKTDAPVATLEGQGSDIVVTLPNPAPTMEDLRNFEIRFAGQDGAYKTVLLKDVAAFSQSETLSSISRIEQRRCITVTAALSQGSNVTLATAAAQAAVDASFTAGEGVTYRFDGENETILSALNDLMLMLLLGVAIVYLIMVAQFQSLLSPLIVMFTIPLAFTGGAIALLIGGFEISIVAMIGFIILVGIIVNNGIVLIDAANQLRQDGMAVRPALTEACRTRLRPVLMTALTTILGLIPLALGNGMGASLIQPVAVVAVGGLIYATFMTLFIVPGLYSLAFESKEKRALARAAKAAEGAEEAKQAE